MRSALTAQPTLLVRDGVLLDEALRGQRVAVAEVGRQCGAPAEGTFTTWPRSCWRPTGLSA